LLGRWFQETNSILTAKVLHLFMPMDNTEKLVFPFNFQRMTSTSNAQEGIVLQYS